MSSVQPPSIPAPAELRTLRDVLNGVLDGTEPKRVSELQQLVFAASDVLMQARPTPPDPVVDGWQHDEGNGATGA